jgi:hypothetical protein
MICRRRANQFTEQTSGFVRDLMRRWLHRLRKARDHLGIDWISLGPLANSLCEVANLCRVGDYQWQLRAADRGCHYGLKPASRLHHNQHGRVRSQPVNQLFQPLAVATDRKGLPARTHVHVQPILRHIDANVSLLHGDPFLAQSGSFAAQATVRVRWNDGRGAKLRNGLYCPRTMRSPVRHRIG